MLDLHSPNGGGSLGFDGGSFVSENYDISSYAGPIEVAFSVVTSVNTEGYAVRTLLAHGVRVPEPGTLALFGLGLAGLGFARRRKVA